jgi:hypothetical protein
VVSFLYLADINFIRPIFMNAYALIGYPLGHSFSKKYFTEKFEKMGLSETHEYKLFELPDIQELPQLLKNETEPERLKRDNSAQTGSNAFFR